MTERLLADPPLPGAAVELGEGIVRLTAPNPSIMTGPGTNTYLVGGECLVAIDPGPALDRHLDAVAEEAARRGALRAIVVTHHHDDHAEGANGLRARTGAPVLSERRMGRLEPDRLIGEGAVVDDGDLVLTALHTPGHASDHLCFALDTGTRVLFSGDHVMGGSTVVIAPPDGDMAAYLASLERLLHLRPAFDAIAPGHGGVLGEPTAVLAEYIAHRLAREEAVRAALVRRGRASVEELVSDVYLDVEPHLHGIARYSLWAHLQKLSSDGKARSADPLDIDAPWETVPADGM